MDDHKHFFSNQNLAGSYRTFRRRTLGTAGSIEQPCYLMGDPDQLAFVLFLIRLNYADQDPQLCPRMYVICRYPYWLSVFQAV
jgi:hypothetical protein